MLIAKRTYRIFFYTLLLAVYAAFFSVQFFFNFEAFSNTGSSPTYTHSASLHKDHRERAEFTKKSPGNSSSGISFRLNKRFQQEDMPPCEQTSIVAPVRYGAHSVHGYYRGAFLPSVTPVNQPLRGPPFAAC
jgi:hypothetical protein